MELEFAGLLAVNHDFSVADAVEAGKYTFSDCRITEDNFPSTRRGSEYRDVFLVKNWESFGDAEQTDAALREAGLRPLDLRELLSYGSLACRCPSAQRSTTIVGLGSPWWSAHGDRYFVCLFPSSTFRCLCLASFEECQPGCLLATTPL